MILEDLRQSFLGSQQVFINNNHCLKMHIAPMEEKLKLGPLLTLDYQQMEGLSLKWNFCGIKPEKTYNSHCFIMENNEDYSQFLQNYYCQLGLGELFGVVRKSSQRAGSKITWNEKIANHQLGQQFLKKKKNAHALQDLATIIETVFQQISNKRGIIMINVLLSKHTSQSEIYNFYETLKILVNRVRSKMEFSGAPVINVIHWENLDNCINVQSGINLFMRGRNSQGMCGFLKKYCSAIKISKIKITMQLLNSHLFFGFSNAHNWIAQDFITYSKTVYCLPNINFTDHIIFINSNTDSQLNLDLNFKLVVEFIDGSQMKSQVNYQINQSLSKIYSSTLTIKADEQFNSIYMFGDAFLTNLCNQSNVISISCEQNRKGNKKRQTLKKMPNTVYYSRMQ